MMSFVFPPISDLILDLAQGFMTVISALKNVGLQKRQSKMHGVLRCSIFSVLKMQYPIYGLEGLMFEMAV